MRPHYALLLDVIVFVLCYCQFLTSINKFRIPNDNVCMHTVQQQEGQPAKPSSVSFKTFGQTSLLTHKQ